MAIFYPYYCLRAAFSSPLNEDLYHKRWALNSADPAIDYFQKSLKKSSKFSFEEQIQGFEIYVYVCRIVWSSAICPDLVNNFFGVDRGRKFDLL